MKILLDTQSFLWFVNGDNKLSKVAIRSIENPANEKLLSLASIWELAIKIGLDKIKITGNLRDFILDETNKNGISIQHIKEDHIFKLVSLPYIHKDPFDRLLVCQCLIENISIISSDKVFEEYDVNRIW